MRFLFSLLLTVIFFSLTALPASATLLPGTAKLIDRFFGPGSAAKSIQAPKILKVKFTDERPVDLLKDCQNLFKRCQKDRKQSYKIRQAYCQKEKHYICPPKQSDAQIKRICTNNKSNCLKTSRSYNQMIKKRLSADIVMTRIGGISTRLKILFRRPAATKSSSGKARLLVIRDIIHKWSGDTTSKIIYEAELREISYLTLRLPSYKNLCASPLNLLTILVQTDTALYRASRAFDIIVACEEDL